MSTYQSLRFSEFHFDGAETKISLSRLIKQLRRENDDVPDIYFILLDAAGLSPVLAQNQIAKTEERELGPSQSMNVVGCKDCTLKLELLFLLYSV